MKRHWKRHATVVLIALATLLVWAVWQRHKSEHAREARQQIAVDELRRKVATFAEQRRAVTDWQKDLGSEGDGLDLYTADLQARLVRADGRPIFFFGQVADVKTGSDGYVVRFESQPRPLAEVDFDLACEAGTTNELLRRRADFLGDYAVVAQISEVRVDESRHGEGGGKIFLASGRCIDVMPVGPEGYSLGFSWTDAK